MTSVPGGQPESPARHGPPEDLMRTRTPVQRMVLLAYGIVEYSVALDHMRALVRAGGVHVPTVTIGRLETERLELLERWYGEHRLRLDPSIRPEALLSDVRKYLQDHEDELRELLTELER